MAKGSLLGRFPNSVSNSIWSRDAAKQPLTDEEATPQWLQGGSVTDLLIDIEVAAGLKTQRVVDLDDFAFRLRRAAS
jgi:hypothetical protein